MLTSSYQYPEKVHRIGVTSIPGPLLGGAFGALFYQQVFSGVNSAAFWIVGAICLAAILGAQLMDKEHKARPKVSSKERL